MSLEGLPMPGRRSSPALAFRGAAGERSAEARNRAHNSLHPHNLEGGNHKCNREMYFFISLDSYPALSHQAGSERFTSYKNTGLKQYNKIQYCSNILEREGKNGAFMESAS